MLLAFLLRAHTLGDPNYRMDESFYLLVGERIRGGASLYTDIWDRKPPGLFLIYALAANFSDPVLAYQIFALLCAGSTAWVIAKIIEPIATLQTQALCVFWYLTSLTLLDGGGGQSPVFYNLPMALSGWLVIQSLGAWKAFPTWRILLAMLLAGTALIIKQTALVECCTIGMFVLWSRWKAGATADSLGAWAVLLGLCGALPALTVISWFWISGDFWPFEWAMIGSNTSRWSHYVDPQAQTRLVKSLAVISPALFLAAWSFIVGLGNPLFRFRGLIAVWLLAALASALSIPTHYYHYLLPVLVPLTVAIAYIVDRRGIAKIMLAALIAIGLFSEPVWSNAATLRHQAEIDQLSELVRKHDPKPRLFVFQGPTALYLALRAKPLGPLVFPPHLYANSERNASHLDTAQEISRILSLRPSTVIVWANQKPNPNLEAVGLVRNYVENHCQRVGRRFVNEEGGSKVEVVVWSRCM